MRKIICCGQVLKTKRDVLAHYEKVEWNGDTRPFRVCITHRRFQKSCMNCKNAKFINKIEEALRPKGLTLSDYLV